MAKVIEQSNRPALILAHDRTLAAQLYHEFKQFFPSNAVEYFVRMNSCAGLTPDDCRGVWALGAVGASVTWGHGLIGDCSGPNCRRSRSDDSIGCNQVHEAFGEEALVREGMPCCSYTLTEQATVRSMHPGGVNALIMDGSTRFISDDVDLSVWHAMHSRETRDVSRPWRTGPRP